MSKAWVELSWKGQRVYLPEYTRLFRNVERKIVQCLLELGFEECLFPKLLTYKQYCELTKAFPRFSTEWSKEVINANNENKEAEFPKKYTLAHWQCEPFYYLLKKKMDINDNDLKYFDRSGWTYRVEEDITDYRLFEFQRIECVWLSTSKKSIETLNILLKNLKDIFSEFGLKTRISRREDEEQETGELIVKDIEAFIDSDWVEIVGSHLHGRLFIEKLEIPVAEDYYTGCCGIGTSRITNLLVRINEGKK